MSKLHKVTSNETEVEFNIGNIFETKISQPSSIDMITYSTIRSAPHHYCRPRKDFLGHMLKYAYIIEDLWEYPRSVEFGDKFLQTSIVEGKSKVSPFECIQWRKQGLGKLLSKFQFHRKCIWRRCGMYGWKILHFQLNDIWLPKSPLIQSPNLLLIALLNPKCLSERKGEAQNQ